MREIKYKGKYLELTEELISGHFFERVKLRSGVKVIPIRGDKILFIREFKINEKLSSLKLVSGWMDKEGKSCVEIAQEELAEEVSLKAGKWDIFHTMDSTNYTVENNITYFLASEISEISEIENPDHDTVEEKIWLNEKEFWKKMDNKEIPWMTDSTIAAMVYRKMQN